MDADDEAFARSMRQLRGVTPKPAVIQAQPTLDSEIVTVSVDTLSGRALDSVGRPLGGIVRRGWWRNGVYEEETDESFRESILKETRKRHQRHRVLSSEEGG